MPQRSLFPFVPFLLLAVPILEICVFILLGQQIGVVYTLLGILLTAMIGTVLLRHQGFALFGQAQQQMNAGKLPGRELAHGVMLLAAGLLLLTPGFVTDTFGFLLLVPAIRDAIFAYFKSRVSFTTMQGQTFSQSYDSSSGTHYETHSYQSYSGNSKSDDPSIIDLDEDDFNEVADHNVISNGNSNHSPWNKNS
ncbi:FxsA family protein [uncultured Cohaesibacter sp.]|uniref:FxsA family protein n=1 Tax=uncultured Cohaesibacter sp. TaxID=1002546 RepID=UPI00292DDCE9|nr:FxsA family protein [uncultured Cohaesibacter sp.]